jgi:hypothetical protein
MEIKINKMTKKRIALEAYISPKVPLKKSKYKIAGTKKPIR